MSRYGIDTNANAQALLGGLALGQRRREDEDQYRLALSALEERRQQNDLQNNQRAGTSQYLQSIYGNHPLPDGFDYGMVDPSAIGSGAEWQHKLRQQQADSELLAAVYGDRPLNLTGNESPTVARFGVDQAMGQRDEQQNAAGMRNYLATARGQGSGFEGPPSPDIAALEGMNSAALAPMVRETAKGELQRRGNEERRQRLIGAILTLKKKVDAHDGWTQQQADPVLRAWELELEGMDATDARMMAMGRANDARPGLTADVLAQTLMRRSPGMTPDQAKVQAQDLLNINALDGGVQQSVLDPSRGVKIERQRRIAGLKGLYDAARNRVSMIPSRDRDPGNPVFVRAEEHMRQAQAAWENAITEAMTEQDPVTAPAPSPAPTSAPPIPGGSSDGIDAAMESNPQQPGEPDDDYVARIKALLSGAPR